MEENDGKPFPAYIQLLKAMNQAFLAIAGDHGSIVFSQKYAPEILAIKAVQTFTSYLKYKAREYAIF